MPSPLRRPLRPTVSRLLLTLGAALAAGCDASTTPEPGACPPPRPAFSLTIRAVDGRELAQDTTIDVSYGGSGREQFSLSQPRTEGRVVFCETPTDDDRADGGAPDATSIIEPRTTKPTRIRCELWTHGAARVTVESEGLVSRTQALEARVDGCGIVTTDVTLELTPGAEPDGEE